MTAVKLKSFEENKQLMALAIQYDTDPSKLQDGIVSRAKENAMGAKAGTPPNQESIVLGKSSIDFADIASTAVYQRYFMDIVNGYFITEKYQKLLEAALEAAEDDNNWITTTKFPNGTVATNFNVKGKIDAIKSLLEMISKGAQPNVPNTLIMNNFGTPASLPQDRKPTNILGRK